MCPAKKCLQCASEFEGSKALCPTCLGNRSMLDSEKDKTVIAGSEAKRGRRIEAIFTLNLGFIFVGYIFLKERLSFQFFIILIVFAVMANLLIFILKQLRGTPDPINSRPTRDRDMGKTPREEGIEVDDWDYPAAGEEDNSS